MRNVPGWDVRFVAKEKGDTRDRRRRPRPGRRPRLDESTAPDIVLVPGGNGSRPLMHDEELLQWLRDVDRTTKWTTSVCTGSLCSAPPACSRASAPPATGSSWSAAPFGADPVGGRWVEDGKVVTAAGVTAGIDMALHLVAQEVGPEVAQAVQLGIEYDPTRPSTPAPGEGASRRSSSSSAAVAGANGPRR